MSTGHTQFRPVMNAEACGMAWFGRFGFVRVFSSRASGDVVVFGGRTVRHARPWPSLEERDADVANVLVPVQDLDLDCWVQARHLHVAGVYHVRRVATPNLESNDSQRSLQ